MADTPWIGATDDKLYLQSGQFTSTIKDSESVNSIDAAPYGVSFDGTNTPWTGRSADKLYLQSGQFTSTLKTSEDVNAIESRPEGISWDGTNTPWTGWGDDKLYLQSGQFTSTMKTSRDISGIDADSTGISADGTNTPWTGWAIGRLILQSGQFTSTVKDSEDVSGIDDSVEGISWDGTNTPWAGAQASKLYLQSGQFTSTLKTSEDVSAVDSYAADICTNDYFARVGSSSSSSSTSYSSSSTSSSSSSSSLSSSSSTSSSSSSTSSSSTSSSSTSVSSSSSSSSYSHSSSSTSSTSSSSSSHISSHPDVYLKDPVNATTQVAIDDEVEFKVTDTVFGTARNTFNVTQNSNEVITEGLLQNGWTLYAKPELFDVLGNNISAGKCNWGSFTGLADSVRYYDDFSDNEVDWDADLSDEEKSRRWSRWIVGPNTTITHDDPNDAIDFYINSGIDEYGYMFMSGEAIGSSDGTGGHQVRLSGDFDLQFLFDVVSRHGSGKDGSAFSVYLTKEINPLADKIMLARYYTPSQATVDGFVSAQGAPVGHPLDLLGDDAQTPGTLTNLGFKFVRSGSDITTFYTINNGSNWLPLGTYIGWGNDDLYCWIGNFTWGTGDENRVRLRFMEMVTGATDKTRDISYNLIPPSDLDAGKLYLFDFYGENYRGGYEPNHTWWFYTAPGTIVVDNQTPLVNADGVSPDTDIDFDLSIPNDGINMGYLDVQVNIEEECNQVQNYEDVIIKSVAQTGYSVSYTYSDLTRLLVDRFEGPTIDTFTRWGSIGSIGTWSQDDTLNYDSGSDTGESKLSVDTKGVIQGDFDIIMDGLIAQWPSTDAYVALEIDDGVKKIQVGRVTGAAKDAWRCDKQDTPGGFTTDVHEENTSELLISGVRLRRLDGSSNVECSYLVSSPHYQWKVLGVIPFSVDDVKVGLVGYNSNSGDPVEVDFYSVEVLKGTGTFAGKVTVSINPDSAFPEGSLPSPKVTVRSWAGSRLNNYVWPFWIQDLTDPNIKFWYPAVNPTDQLKIDHGTDALVPNLQVTKFTRRNETAAGYLRVRNVGYTEEKINLSVLLATKCEIENFKSFFFDVIKGKSRIFHYKNYVTGDEADVRLLSDMIPIQSDGGDPYSFRMTMRKEAVSSSSSSAPVLINWQYPTMGFRHSFLLKYSSVELYASGNNGSGQLGLGDTTERYVHTQVGSGTDWAKVEAGAFHTVALKTDGTLWASGYNAYGQFGNGTTSNSNVFIQIGSDTDWVNIAAGGEADIDYGHTLAVKSNGTLWTTGYNNVGQLGLGDNADRDTFTQVGSDTDWDKVYASPNNNSWAIKTDGTVWRCGDGSWAQLGTGNYNDLNVFTQLGIATNWVMVGAGWSHTVLLNSSGELWGCGNNQQWQLNIDGDADYPNLVQMGSDTDWAFVSAGFLNTLAIKTNGKMYGCGDNDAGVIGIGNVSGPMLFTQESNGFTDWVSVGYKWEVSLAVRSGGLLYGAGTDLVGAMGSGGNSYDVYTLIS